MERSSRRPLSAEGVRAAPPERFEAMTEEVAVSAARESMRDDRAEKAQAILNRYDDPQAVAETQGTTEESDEESDPFTRTSACMVDAFTEEEITEEDIGGYFYDIRFVVSSLRSRAFHLLVVFLGTMIAVFTFLYRGGIGVIRRDFLSRIPAPVRPSPGQTQWPITLHPVEALVFEMKLAAIIGAVVTLPLLFYYAWPALAEREIVAGNRTAIGVWKGVLLGGFAADRRTLEHCVSPNRAPI
ncbi:MAG: twin-arginine translocase subunit TatC [Halanaeroarchaeum sp.]